MIMGPEWSVSDHLVNGGRPMADGGGSGGSSSSDGGADVSQSQRFRAGTWVRSREAYHRKDSAS